MGSRESPARTGDVRDNVIQVLRSRFDRNGFLIIMNYALTHAYILADTSTVRVDQDLPTCES